MTRYHFRNSADSLLYYLQIDHNVWLNEPVVVLIGGLKRYNKLSSQVGVYGKIFFLAKSGLWCPVMKGPVYTSSKSLPQTNVVKRVALS